jgi:hypothetical protein
LTVKPAEGRPSARTNIPQAASLQVASAHVFTEVAMPDAKPKPVINFYSTTGEYGCFSNFSKQAIHLKGKRWATSEHYFQAQ